MIAIADSIHLRVHGVRPVPEAGSPAHAVVDSIAQGDITLAAALLVVARAADFGTDDGSFALTAMSIAGFTFEYGRLLQVPGLLENMTTSMPPTYVKFTYEWSLAPGAKWHDFITLHKVARALARAYVAYTGPQVTDYLRSLR